MQVHLYQTLITFMKQQIEKIGTVNYCEIFYDIFENPIWIFFPTIT